jgi:GNAT superfamily N-acetyltransferase
MIRFQVEHFDKEKAKGFIEEMLPLGKAHHDEAFPNEVFDPDVQVLGMAWQSGSMKIITARDEGRLVGYIVWSIGPDIFNKSISATCLALYLEKEARGKGKEMLEFSVQIMLALGAKPRRILVSTSDGTPHGRWFSSCGFVKVGEAYSYGH